MLKIHEITDMLKSEMGWEFNNDNKIGHIRCQFGWEKQIANQFVKTEKMSEIVKEFNIDLKRVNEISDSIQFVWLENYERIEMYCKGVGNNKEETNYFVQDGNVNYWIRLNPFGTQEYNAYIHIFHA